VGRAWYDRYGERHTLSAIDVACIVALGGYELMTDVWFACLFCVIDRFGCREGEVRPA